jgi:hypothetical protein
MNRTTGLTIIIFLVFLGTIFVLFAQQPEQRIAYSEDGQVRLEYMAESGRYLQIDTLAGVIPVHTVSPTDYVFAQPATLVFNYDPATPEVHIAAYNLETEAWQILPTERHVSNSELSTQITKVAQWALIEYNDDAQN